MKATICDRCNNSFVGEIKRGEQKYTLCRINSNNAKMSRGSRLDLCPKCYRDLLSWIDMKDKNGLD